MGGHSRYIDPVARKGRAMSQVFEAHRKSVSADLQTMASTLVEVLGRPITAYMVHVRNVKTISRWANGEVASVRDRYSEERLLATYQVVMLLREYQEHPETIRSFMMGMNPVLNDESPAHAIREGNFKGALDAAKVHVAGSY